jgi:predicted O-methyltransferase YrrM
MFSTAESLTFRAGSFANYLLQAKTHYYIHSPFAYSFITDVLNDRKIYPEYDTLQALHEMQRDDKTQLIFSPAGTSTQKISSTVSIISKQYSLPSRFAKLLFRLVRKLKPNVILETGTGLGFSSAALASGNINGKIYTVDAVEQLSNIARAYHHQSEIRNINYIIGNADDVLENIASVIKPVDLVYLDANHTSDATLRYFQILLRHLSSDACVVVDDIHWSADMKKAWLHLCRHKAVSLSIDLYRLGMLFLNPSLNREALRLYY